VKLGGIRIAAQGLFLTGGKMCAPMKKAKTRIWGRTCRSAGSDFRETPGANEHAFARRTLESRFPSCRPRTQTDLGGITLRNGIKFARDDRFLSGDRFTRNEARWGWIRRETFPSLFRC
jgi:hypothetical protein